MILKEIMKAFNLKYSLTHTWNHFNLEQSMVKSYRKWLEELCGATKEEDCKANWRIKIPKQIGEWRLKTPMILTINSWFKRMKGRGLNILCIVSRSQQEVCWSRRRSGVNVGRPALRVAHSSGDGESAEPEGMKCSFVALGLSGGGALISLNPNLI